MNSASPETPAAEDVELRRITSSMQLQDDDQEESNKRNRFTANDDDKKASDLFQQYLAEVASNASIVMSIPEGWAVRRPDEAPGLADYNECFRLYFGLNVTVFPFIFALGGSIGTLIFTLPIAILLQESIASQLRAKDSVLEHVFRDHGKHHEINTYMKLTDALWSYPVTTTGGGEVSLVVTSKIPLLVRSLILFAQFTGACSFTMLLAENIAALFVVDLTTSLFVSCVAMVLLSSAYTPRTCKYFAYSSNSCLLLSVGIMLFVVMRGDALGGSTVTEAAPAWSFPRTTGDLMLLLPFFTGALSASLFALDVEGSVSDRVVARTKQRNDHSNVIVSSSCGPLSTLPYANDLPASYRPTRARTHFLLTRFENMTYIALGLALTVHVTFGEIVFHRFTDSTNCVLALSLAASSTRSALLLILSVGAGMCAAYNVSAIGLLMDTLQPFSRMMRSGGTITAVVDSLAVRTVLYAGVFAVLYSVPYFDLISSLSGAVGYTSFSLILPAVFDLQAVRRRIEFTTPEGRPSTSCAATYGDAFRMARFRVKLAIVGQFTVGVFVLITGTYISIAKTVQRSGK